MINCINIFYSSKTGSGLEPIQTKGKGLERFKLKREKDVTKKNVIKNDLRGVV